VAYGPGLYQATAGVQNSIQVQVFDKYLNAYTTGDSSTASLLGLTLFGPTNVSSSSVSYIGGGVYSIFYMTQVASTNNGAKFSASITYNNVQIGGSYVQILQVLPGKLIEHGIL
jgi:hypothetical protein